MIQVFLRKDGTWFKKAAPCHVVNAPRETMVLELESTYFPILEKEGFPWTKPINFRLAAADYDHGVGIYRET